MGCLPQYHPLHRPTAVKVRQNMGTATQSMLQLVAMQTTCSSPNCTRSRQMYQPHNSPTRAAVISTPSSQ